MEKNSKVKEFFLLNLEIKSIILNISPFREKKERYFYPTLEDEFIAYGDQINDSLLFIVESLIKIIDSFKFSDIVRKKICMKLKNILESFCYCVNMESLKTFYEQFILGLTSDACKRINENFYAYNPQYEHSALEVIDSCNTINEILHFLHSYISTNERSYQDVHVLCSYETNENKIYLKGEVSDISLALYKEYVENRRPMQYPVEILDIGDNILILAGTKDMTISCIIDVTTPKINIDFKIYGDISDEEIDILTKILNKKGARNLTIERAGSVILGLVICDVETLTNIVASEDGLINFIACDGIKVRRKKGEV